MGDDGTGRRAKGERRRAERLARLSERTPARFAARRNRRLLAAVGAGLLALPWADAAVSWWLAPSDTAMIVNFVVVGVLLVAGVPLYGWLIMITRGATSLDERYLDERQVTDRLRAFTAAHRGTSVVIIAIGVLVTLGDGEGRDASVPAAANFLLIFALLVTHLGLPLVIAAWRSPDPPPDEDDEDDDGEVREVAEKDRVVEGESGSAGAASG